MGKNGQDHSSDTKACDVRLAVFHVVRILLGFEIQMQKNDQSKKMFGV